MGVSVRRGEYVLLSQLDWRVQQGQIWAVKGLNGSGKSTTARLIMVRAIRALSVPVPFRSVTVH